MSHVIAASSDRQSLDALFDPRSVAIVGASTDAEKLSGQPLRNLIACGYEGTIHVVHPTADVIEGVRCVRSVGDIDEPVDLALVVVPPRNVVEAVQSCAESGVLVCIVGVSGFAEEGTDEGEERQRELARIAGSSGMRIVGPNTNGIYNADQRVSVGYNSAHATVIPPGALSVVSHSGALFSVIARRIARAGTGLAKFVSVGNEADLSMLDYVEYLIDDRNTGVIGLVVESISDGDRFARAVRAAHQAGKHVVVLKLGQSAQGAATTAAHSSRLAGSPRAYEAFLSGLGVPMVSSVEALVGAASALSGVEDPPGWPRSGAVGVTASGAGSSLLADGAAGAGVPLVSLDVNTLEKLDGFPRTSRVVNPVDIGAIGGSAHIREVLPIVASDPGADVVLYFAHVLQTSWQRAAFVESIVASKKSHPKPHLVLAPGSLTTWEEQVLSDAGVPVFHDSAAYFETVAALFTRPDDGERLDREGLQMPEMAAPGPSRVLDEVISGSLLARFGVPVVESIVVGSVDAAVSAAESLGYPVVIKAIVSGVAHKSDVGLVALDLVGDSSVEVAFDQVTRAAERMGGTSKVVVQRMVPGGIEAIVGLTDEPGIGQFLVCGLGGIYAEDLNDVTVMPLSSSRDRMHRMLASSSLGRILTSRRRKSEVGIGALTDVLCGLRDLAVAAEGAIESVDINPLVIGDDELIAVDALVILSDERIDTNEVSYKEVTA